MPSNDGHFDATSSLPGGWRVTAFVPGQRLTLARAGQAQLKELGRKAFVSVAALVIALALAAATRTDPGFRLVLAPVLVLLGLVVLLGALSVFRVLRRATAGSHLAFDATSGLLSGFLEEGSSALVVSRLDQLEALVVEVRRGAGPDARTPKSWATLQVRLKDGRQLAAPEAWGPDSEWERTVQLLLPAARELSRLSAVPLQVRQQWDGAVREECS